MFCRKQEHTSYDKKRVAIGLSLDSFMNSWDLDENGVTFLQRVLWINWAQWTRTSTIYKSLLPSCFNLSLELSRTPASDQSFIMNQSQPTTVPTHPQQPLLYLSTLVPMQQPLAPSQQQHQIPALTNLSRYPRKKGSRKAESLSNPNVHESTGTVFNDLSTGVDPGNAMIDASINPGIRKVWRTPSRNPLMANCNLT